MLNKLIKQILNENVSVDEINNAIDNHNRIVINYHTKGEDKETGARVIEVYAYGLTKSGIPVIRAFQPYGSTTTRVPAWKFFRLDRISYWKPTDQTFSRPASFYYQGLGKFNPNDDLTMSTVYKIAKFNNDNVFKTDSEINMERTKEQLNNPITLDDLKKQNANTKDKVNKKLQEPEKTDDVYKTDTEKGMENLKKQLENPKYINDYRKENGIDNLRQKLGDTSEPIKMKDFNKKLQEPEKTDDVYKTDTEKGMENLKKQLENPKYINLDNIPKR